MSMASARTWEELGRGLSGIGARISQDRQLDEEQQRRDIAEKHQLGRERTQDSRQRMQDDIELARLGGGRGPAPTDEDTEIVGTGERPKFEAPDLFERGGMNAGRSPLAPAATGAPPMFEGARAGAAAGAGPGLVADQPEGPMFGDADHEIRGRLSYDRSVGRYAPVGDDAYITRPDVLETDRAGMTDSRELEMYRGKGMIDEEIQSLKIPAIASRIAQVTGRPREEAEAAAALIAAGHATFGQIFQEEEGTNTNLTTRRTLATGAASAIRQLVRYDDESEDAFNSRRNSVAVDHGFGSALDVAAELKAVGVAAGREGVAPPAAPPVDVGAQTRSAMAGYPDASIDATIARRSAGAQAATVAAPAPAPAAGAPPRRPITQDQADYLREMKGMKDEDIMQQYEVR